VVRWSARPAKDDGNQRTARALDDEGIPVVLDYADAAAAVLTGPAEKAVYELAGD
jgi:hypothetical protein